MDYRKLLEYYLSSDEWEFELRCFFEEWQHCFIPGEEIYGQKNEEPVRSEVYRQYERKLADAGGCYYGLHLTEPQFRKYFDIRYSPKQRFAVLFGMWWGLEEMQIRRISDLKQKKYCSSWLNYFLCNPKKNGSDMTKDEVLQFTLKLPHR